MEMKKTRRFVVSAVLMLMAIALVAMPASAQKATTGGWGCGMGMGGGVGMGRGMGPAFTQDQLDRIQKIHEKYADQRAELTNKLKAIMVEAREKSSDTPDFNAIEQRMEEVSKLRLQLSKLRLKIQQETWPLLTDDQKVLFGRSIGHMGSGMRDHACGHGARGWSRGGRGMNRGMCGMGGRAWGGQMMQGAPGHPGMGPGQGMGPGAGSRQGWGMGGGTMPWCPYNQQQNEEPKPE
jgi:Spy/CpxP family protein refolding chaperone